MYIDTFCFNQTDFHTNYAWATNFRSSCSSAFRDILFYVKVLIKNTILLKVYTKYNFNSISLFFQSFNIAVRKYFAEEKPRVGTMIKYSTVTLTFLFLSFLTTKVLYNMTIITVEYALSHNKQLNQIMPKVTQICIKIVTVSFKLVYMQLNC